MDTSRLTLVPGQWYGWQMLPGYGDAANGAYFSPIRARRVIPKKTGRGILELQFRNALYAEGVQEFRLDLKILRHERDYLVASLLYGEGGPTDRTAVVSRIGLDWVRRLCPGVWDAHPVDYMDDARPADINDYLGRVFGES